MTRDAKKAVRQEAIDRLKVWIKPGDTVFTQMKHCSRSGMQRTIQIIKPAINDRTGEIDMIYLGYNVAQALDMRYDRDREGVKIGGCGMDMGFALVYDLSRTLFSEFECIGEGCPANDHFNGDRDYTPHKHSDGGYALKHRWI